jgi:pyruvate dehydrogenase E2 component (dihydrolipoamide acetyltransferase)
VAGVLTEIRVEEGETVDVGTVIAVVGGANDAAEHGPVAAPAPPQSDPAPAPPPVPAASALPAPVPAKAGTNRLLSPVVRRLVGEHGLDVDSISGSGPGGRITRDDVLAHIDAVASSRPAAPDPAPAPVPAAAAVPDEAGEAPPSRAPVAGATPSVLAGERERRR